ncbi:hypothetical protein MKZ38_005473 [Zalerion maritima]|uniref:NADP-dependent oxidoreductase domain-containing protein n=1 Tax=Zalerion maritima TaxID=339359 RepID=A0AAD5RKZ7_9PEZI|nr:hypothetical protein MKZ38_005473 [Zalerion maritima]
MATSNKSPRTPLSEVLPPLILGTATFNHQYVDDPHSMPSVQIVKRALALGVSAFDTSPYYGPSEVILGNALKTLHKVTKLAPNPLKREDYFLITKAGRIAGDEFDYSPEWIRYSVFRSLERLGTDHLDLVYTHDVEFVSFTEALAAVKELRKLRDEGYLKYVGISAYPLDVLCDLAEFIHKETGEPIDAAMSYGHFTVQNTTLATQGLARLKKAGVQVVPSASMLGLGLLSTRGIDAGPMKVWHPASTGLKEVMKTVVQAVQAEGGRMETVALAYALSQWGARGADLGSKVQGNSTGISVMGVSTVDELEETVRLWNESLSTDPEAAKKNQEAKAFVEEKLWPILGNWKDNSWDSPGPCFVNTRKPEDKGKVPDDGLVEKYEASKPNV